MHDAHDALAEVSAILGRSKEALGQFQAILEPTIEQAADDHERLYWHHIYEEEEHRFDRLAALLPKLEEALADEAFLSRENGDFLRLLQDISLEKFGLHNFLEHLDLSLFHYKGTEHEPAIAALRDMTAADYQQMKAALETLNRALDAPLSFDASVPTDEKEHQKDHLKLAQYAVPPSDPAPVRPSIGTRRQLTVGSLKHG